jgi:methionine synthase II (cobalamin-independent)
MSTQFKPGCAPLLIGSIPLQDHREATELILKYTPETPLWAQLPSYPQEGMVPQFLPGMPGYSVSDGKEYVDTESEGFEAELLQLYEEYMAATEAGEPLDNTRFKLTEDRAKGFFDLLDKLRNENQTLLAVKGQITGPITFATGVKDQSKKAVFYDEQLRDAAVKLLALKAGWQTEKLSEFNVPVIVFFDEPALAGFGSSEFMSISKQDVMDCFSEVIEPVHARQGLTGIHVCANADWSIILESEADILSFDAYSYFDKLVIYADSLKQFLERGGIIAWGIVPTLEPADIEKESVDSLLDQMEDKLKQLQDLGFDRRQLLEQSFITPSCGTGSLSFELADTVLHLTKGVSDRLRQELTDG